MLNENFIYLAISFNILGNFSYLKAVVGGKAKPHKVSWFIWALAPLIAFAAQISQGVGISSLMTFAVGFGPLLVFLASFLNRKAVWKISNFDYFCLILSLMAVILWIITKDALLALILSIVADAIACIPTLIKSWYFPETEDYKAYLFAGISAFITTLTIHDWNFQTFAFPIWILIICLVFVLLIKFSIGKHFK